MLLLVVYPRLAHGDGGQDADAARRLVMPGNKHGVIESGAYDTQKFVGSDVGSKDLFLIFPHRSLHIVQMRAYHGELAAGYDKALLVNDAYGSVRGFLHLYNDALKYPA